MDVCCAFRTIVILILPFVPSPQINLWVRILGYAGLYILLGLGLLIHVGFAGLLDLGFAAYYGIGAYTYAMFASTPVWYSPSLLGHAPGGGLGRSPGGRFDLHPRAHGLRGDYLAIVTLGFGEITRLLLSNLQQYHQWFARDHPHR